MSVASEFGTTMINVANALGALNESERAPVAAYLTSRMARQVLTLHRDGKIFVSA